MIDKTNKGYYIGKIRDLAKGKGWFYGHFMDEGPLQNDDVEIAWQELSNMRTIPDNRHYHKNSVEINIVISGSLDITIDGVSVHVEKGEFYIIFPLAVVEKIDAGPQTEVIVVRTPSIENDKVLLN
jgi:mannose-6-phosphate isomerase-like protein (cupin superfamily)